MCRPNALGGRRCPSHSDPTFVANRNARRRQQYAKNKRQTTKKSSHKLNITTTSIQGHLVDMGYLSPVEVDGVIDFTQLDEESYKLFGFKKPDQLSVFEEGEAIELSKEELKDCSLEEKSALNLFTTSDYKWINNSLYKVEPVIEGSEDDEPYYQAKNTTPFDRIYLKYEDRTETVVKDTADLLDSVLRSAPHRSRIVYRGMSKANKAYGDLTATEWAEQKLKIGQEMVLDGYQSSSLDQKASLDVYSEDGGIMYEILTPEGVNLTSVSEWSREMEILLPRKSRYMVVGHHSDISYGSRYNETRNITVIQMVAINDDGAVLNSNVHHQIKELSSDDVLTAPLSEITFT